MAGLSDLPPRCESCGSSLALDELETSGAQWAARQSFGDWDCVADEVENLRNATFVGLHPSFAGALCPNCRYPFTAMEGQSPFGDAYKFDTEDPFGGEQISW